jgi:ribosomal protein S17E
MPIELTYDFCTMEVHENYLYVVMYEGITVKPEHNDILLNISTKYFRNKNFGYITHRKNSYSVDPRVYFETSKIENLVAFAVVSNEKLKTSNTDVEKIFLKKPFQHFEELAEAKAWVLELVESA